MVKKCLRYLVKGVLILVKRTYSLFYFLIQVSPWSTFLNISSFNYITTKIDIPIIKLYYEKKNYIS
jgi:hypothetical protein